MDLYEPIDVPKPVDDGVWIVDGPIERMRLIAWLSMPFSTRMAMVRLESGGLWVWSPTRLSPGLRAHVAALGEVEHIVSPNRLHYAHVAAWKAAYPRAVAWASPGVRARARSQGIEVTFDRDLGDVAEAPWAAEIDQLVFRGSPLLEEVVFFHRRSRALLVADLIQSFEPAKLSFGERLLTRLGGVVDPDGKAPADLRLSFIGHRRAAQSCAARILAWKPERVILAHGRWYPRDGERELRRSLRWLD